MTKAQSISAFRDMASAAGEPLLDKTGPCPRQRFGGHVLRVTGAQFLSRMQVDSATIMLLGRWGSHAVLRYLQQAPLQSLPEVAARMLRPALAPLMAPPPPPPPAPAHSPASDTIYILPVRSNYVHIVAHQEASLPSFAWATKCGWRYGTRSYDRTADLPSDRIKCARCFPGVSKQNAPATADSSESSSSSE